MVSVLWLCSIVQHRSIVHAKAMKDHEECKIAKDHQT
jgi:hypothetical protein